MKYNTLPALPKKKKPIFIIGAGGIVHYAHLPAYQKANFEVGGIYDIDIDKAESLASAFKIKKACHNLDELIKLSLDNDGVFDIALPASAINKILDQLPSGSTVLIQKPMGEDLDQAKQILGVCKQKKMLAGVNFQLRQAPFIILAKQLIDEGVIGKLHDVEVRICAYTPWHLWDFLFEVPRVEIQYHSVHYIDLIRYLLGNPQKIYARTLKNPKTPKLASTRSTIIMDYGDFIRANINTYHGHEFGLDHQESFIKLEGTEGAIKIRLGVVDYPKGLPNKFEYISLKDNKGWQEVKIEGTWFPDAFIGPMAGLMCKMENPAFEYINAVEDAVFTMACVEAAYESDQRGGVALEI